MVQKRLALILGNCLFEDHIGLDLDKDPVVFMAETKDLTTHFTYHKQKILLFLSAMRSQADVLMNNHTIEYHKITDSNKSYVELLSAYVNANGITQIVTYDIEDTFFRDEIVEFCGKNNIDLDVRDSPGFIGSIDDFKSYASGRKKLLMHDFYLHQRKKLGYLLDENNQPIGGKWSFDEDNRKKVPKGFTIPQIIGPTQTVHTQELIETIKSLFPNNPGNLDNFIYPTTHTQAHEWLADFFKNRFANFGPYEDAIESDETFLFHSLLSPLLNCGLLTPRYVVDEAINYAEVNKTPLSSVEGFVRQIIGWREFVRGTYHTLDFNGNFWGHNRSLSEKWYTGETGIAPVDDAIHKVLQYGYNHHIERLMVLGNIMLLCEINPKEVYKWFMEMYVDSADWVMEPNVYGMSQFSAGSLFATKPYICGSNYICKMGNYKKGDDWCEIVDGLYWRFIGTHQKFFSANPRLSMMVKLYEKMDDTKKNRILEKAESFLKEI